MALFDFGHQIIANYIMLLQRYVFVMRPQSDRSVICNTESFLGGLQTCRTYMSSSKDRSFTCSSISPSGLRYQRDIIVPMFRHCLERIALFSHNSKPERRFGLQLLINPVYEIPLLCITITKCFKTQRICNSFTLSCLIRI